MEHNNFTTNLIAVFQDVSLNGITENNIDAIQEVLTYALDSNNTSIFKDLTLINLIYLLDINSSSILIRHLVTEFKFKSLRLMYVDSSNINDCETCMPNEASEQQTDICINSNDDEMPDFSHLPNLPPKGQLGKARHIVSDGKNEIVKIYTVDHTGKALELVDSFTNVKNKMSLNDLNDNVIDKVLAKVEKHKAAKGKAILETPLTENDL